MFFSKLVTITNYKVLTKNNISLRLSYLLEDLVVDSVFVNRFDLLNVFKYNRSNNTITKAKTNLRSAIANIESQTLD